MIKAAIFDLDGTLIDSLHVWKNIDRDFLARRGIAVPQTYFPEIAALSLPEIATYTIQRFGLRDTPQQLLDEWHEMAAHEYENNIRTKPHAGDYLRRINAAGLAVATATSLTPELSEAVLKNNGVFDLFHAFCHTSEVVRGKNFPDVYLLAAEKLGAQPAECVVFEDLPEGVLSAKGAGMMVVGVLEPAFQGGWDVIRGAADVCIQDFSDAPDVASWRVG